MPTILRRLLWIAVVVTGSVNVAMLFWGSQIGGLSWDEVVHINDLSGPQQAANKDHHHFGVYGVSYQLLGHFSAVVLGGQAMGDTTFSTEALLARHYVSAILVVLTAAVVGVLTFLITRKTLVAIWAGVALLSIQVFLGHGMFNPKDIPVAFGYTLVTLGCAYWILLADRVVNEPWPKWVATPIIIAVGVWFAAGSRYIFLPILAISVLVTAILSLLLVRNKKNGTGFLVAALVPVGGLILGILTLYFTNPCALMSRAAQTCSFSELLFRSWQGVSTLASWMPLFLFGQVYSQETKPFWSLPINIFAGMPVLLFLLSIAGLISIAWKLWLNLSRRKRKTNANSFSFVALVPLVIQILLLPTLTILLNASVYDSQRQHLYIYPAMVVIAATLTYDVLYKFWPPEFTGFVKTFVTVTIIAAVAIPTIEGAKLFPYNYVYVNPVASAPGYATNWETDYWALSLREAISLVPKGAGFYVIGPLDSAAPFVYDRGLSPEATKVKLTENEAFAIQIHRPSWALDEPFEGCREVDRVERVIRGMRIPMSYVVVCDEEVIKPNHTRLPLD